MVWQKSFLEEGFSLDSIQNSIWSPLANEICVLIVDDNESEVDKYTVHSGRWSSLRNI